MKKSPNPAAIIGGILFLLSALVLLMINLSTMNMLDYSFATDQLLRVNLIPILYVVTAIFLFIRRPKAAVPVLAAVICLYSFFLGSVFNHSFPSFMVTFGLQVRGLGELFIRLWNPLYLLSLLAFAVLGFLMVSGKGRMLWFLPPALATLSSLMVLSLLLGTALDWELPGEITAVFVLSEIVRTAALWCAARFMAGPGPVMSAAGEGGQGTYGAGGYMAYRAEGYVDLMSCALLLIFTLGIYHLVWIYRTTRYLNRVEVAPSRNPTTKLLLCMFIPFYTIYWTYQSAQRVDALARSKGLYAELTSPCVLLSIFAGIVPPLLMQNTINAVSQTSAPGAAAPGAEETQSAPAAMPAAPAAGQGEEDVIEALKRYKELLDQGVITQEDFDRKKAQLLGQ